MEHNDFDLEHARRGAEATSLKRGELKRLGLCRCGQPRVTGHSQCRECKNRGSALAKHNNSYQQETGDDDPSKAGAVLTPDSIGACRYPGCEWTGTRRELWKHVKEKHS